MRLTASEFLEEILWGRFLWYLLDGASNQTLMKPALGQDWANFAEKNHHTSDSSTGIRKVSSCKTKSWQHLRQTKWARMFISRGVLYSEARTCNDDDTSSSALFAFAPMPLALLAAFPCGKLGSKAAERMLGKPNGSKPNWQCESSSIFFTKLGTMHKQMHSRWLLPSQKFHA